MKPAVLAWSVFQHRLCGPMQLWQTGLYTTKHDGALLDTLVVRQYNYS